MYLSITIMSGYNYSDSHNSLIWRVLQFTI